MDKTAVKKALRTPYKPLLDYAMTFVSLSEKERKVLTLCLIELLTEEKTAEILGYSCDFVARTKKACFRTRAQGVGKDTRSY